MLLNKYIKNKTIKIWGATPASSNLFSVKSAHELDIMVGGRSVTSHPNETQYCPLLAPLNQTFQEVTYPGITLAEARLTAKF
jgi:hypothetical protein